MPGCFSAETAPAESSQPSVASACAFPLHWGVAAGGTASWSDTVVTWRTESRRTGAADRMRMTDPRLQEALRDFTERYSARRGVHSVETGEYAGQACLVAMAGEGFDRTSLPATFMEFPVLVNDGTHGYPAEGASAP